MAATIAIATFGLAAVQGSKGFFSAFKNRIPHKLF